MNAAQKNYICFLDEVGLSESFVRRCSEIETDRSDLKRDGVFVSSSAIEGLGLFTSKEFKAGDLIMPAVINGRRTDAGRYLNHHDKPNAIMEANGDRIDLYATRDISNEEITTDYRDTLSLTESVDTSKSLKLVRNDIQAFENALLELPQIDLPLTHHFSYGVYGREMFVPAGGAFTGMVHKTDHLCILVQGEMLLVASNGAKERICSPRIFVTPANTKKAGYAITDCIFMTVHGTHETDLEKIEAEFVSKEYEEDR